MGCLAHRIDVALASRPGIDVAWVPHPWDWCCAGYGTLRNALQALGLNGSGLGFVSLGRFCSQCPRRNPLKVAYEPQDFDIKLDIAFIRNFVSK